MDVLNDQTIKSRRFKNLKNNKLVEPPHITCAKFNKTTLKLKCTIFFFYYFLY